MVDVGFNSDSIFCHMFNWILVVPLESGDSETFFSYIFFLLLLFYFTNKFMDDSVLVVKLVKLEGVELWSKRKKITVNICDFYHFFRGEFFSA